jgi:hypothetical protein
MNEDRAIHLARTFGCKVGSMPFTYLGLPLGTTKPTIQDFFPLLNKIEKRLCGVGKFLSYHGRLILINSVFTALPIFYMCCLKIPPQVIKQINVFRKHCLWSKGDINRRGSCLVAWETTCKPKDEGGLGIIDIKNQNSALLLKFLDKFYHKDDTPWVDLTWSKLYSNHQTPPQARSPVGSFWWKDIINLFEDFQALSSSKPNKGDTILFWSLTLSDQNQSLKDLFPQLYSFTKKAKCSLQFFTEHDASRLFNLPLSQQAAAQLEEVMNLLEQAEIDDELNDTWVSTKFSSRKAYKQLQEHATASPLFSWLWKSSNTGKQKFFFWLLLRDRLNTRNLLKRKQAFTFSSNVNLAKPAGTTSQSAGTSDSNHWIW